MASIESSFASPPNLQESSVFFTLFPKEIRDQIFDLAITPYEKRDDFLPEGLQYNRLSFRNNHRKITTALLRTCQRIYDETYDIPVRNYIKIDWFFNTGIHGHGCNDSNAGKLVFPAKMQSLHVYARSRDICLYSECYNWGKYLDQVAMQAPDLQYLKMMLGHGEEHMASASDIVLPEPKASNDPKSRFSYKECGWGWHLQKLKNLTILEVEAETIVDSMEELDEAVARAKDWRIIVTAGKTLVLNPQKTRREGWHGPVLIKPRYILVPEIGRGFGRGFAGAYSQKPAPPPNAAEAEERLIKAGVELVQSEDSEGQASINRLTFYAVTLVFEPEMMTGHSNKGSKQVNIPTF